jgi:hypothetical protein
MKFNSPEEQRAFFEYSGALKPTRKAVKLARRTVRRHSCAARIVSFADVLASSFFI